MWTCNRCGTDDNYDDKNECWECSHSRRVVQIAVPVRVVKTDAEIDAENDAKAAKKAASIVPVALKLLAKDGKHAAHTAIVATVKKEGGGFGKHFVRLIQADERFADVVKILPASVLKLAGKTWSERNAV